MPKPGQLGFEVRCDLVYDAWNRLVEVKDGAATVARCEYDGLNRRIVKTAGSGDAATTTTTRPGRCWRSAGDGGGNAHRAIRLASLLHRRLGGAVP